MDYKKVIRSRKSREKILRMLSFIPDKPMLYIQYYIKTGRMLHLKKPVRFTEKLQWYKLFYRDQNMIACVDKYDVREYIESKGYSDILCRCYGVFSNAQDLNADALPKKFVLKDTLGSGGNSIIFCEDKDKMDWPQRMLSLQSWCDTPLVRDGGREWPYYSGKRHRILAEEYLMTSDKTGLMDYKFFCFNGKVEFIYVCENRHSGQSVQIHLASPDYHRLNVSRIGDECSDSLPAKPENYERMLQIAEDLGSDFPHVRVDLYNIDGKILFGELTFFNASGYMLYNPDKFDKEIGDKFLLPPAHSGSAFAKLERGVK